LRCANACSAACTTRRSSLFPPLELTSPASYKHRRRNRSHPSRQAAQFAQIAHIARVRPRPAGPNLRASTLLAATRALASSRRPSRSPPHRSRTSSARDRLRARHPSMTGGRSTPARRTARCARGSTTDKGGRQAALSLQQPGLGVELRGACVEGNADLRAEGEQLVDSALLRRTHIGRRDHADAATSLDHLGQRIAEVAYSSPDHERANEIDRVCRRQLGL
jgi:hypothetical protein